MECIFEPIEYNELIFMKGWTAVKRFMLFSGSIFFGQEMREWTKKVKSYSYLLMVLE